jgi:hypothetical protein
VAPVWEVITATFLNFIFTHPNEAQKMAMAGREAVEKHYNWTTEGKTLIEFYNRFSKVQS